MCPGTWESTCWLVKERLAGAEPLGGTWLPRPNTFRVGINKLQHFEVISMIQPPAQTQIFFVEGLIDCTHLATNPPDETVSHRTGFEGFSGADPSVVRVNDGVGEFALESDHQ